jgi:hypothetical protein
MQVLLLEVTCVVVKYTITVYFTLILIIEQWWREGEIIISFQFMAQSFNFSDRLQHCAVGRCNISGGKFLFAEIPTFM